MISAEITWYLALPMLYLLPIGITLLVLTARRPRRLLVRSIVGILVVWVILILFTAYIYNPVGHSYLEATRGAEYAFNRFDNNTLASVILGGWVIPLLTATVYHWGGAILRHIRS